MEMHEAIRREGLQRGTIVVSLKGHDTGRLYLVADVSGRRAKLTDGRLRPCDKLKNKHVRHCKAVSQLEKKEIERIFNMTDDRRKNAEINEQLELYRRENVKRGRN